MLSKAKLTQDIDSTRNKIATNRRRNQTNLVVIADAGTNPDSVSLGAEHVIHAARWGISLLCVAVANWGNKG